MGSCGWCIIYYIPCLRAKKNMLCRYINVATEAHGDILKIIAILYSDVHESTNPVTE